MKGKQATNFEKGLARSCGQCGPCQPCDVFGLSLKKPSAFTAVVYLLEGFTSLVYMIVFDLGRLLDQTEPTTREELAVYLMLLAALLWVIVSILFLLGVYERNRGLVLTFLVGIPITSVIQLIVVIIVLFTFTDEEKKDRKLLSYAAYTYSIIWPFIKWYLYWVACAFYLEIIVSRRTKGVDPGNDSPEEESPPPPYVESSHHESSPTELHSRKSKRMRSCK